MLFRSAELLTVDGVVAVRGHGLLLAESPLQRAVKRAEDIRTAILRMPLQFENQDLGRITASFGAVAFPDHGRTPEALIRAADRALYAAKNAGRNQVVAANQTLQ